MIFVNRQSTRSSALLKHYHWLPNPQIKITCITYKTIHTTQPAFLNSVLEHYTPARTLRSSDTNLLSAPRVCTCFGSRSFSAAAPTLWNSLPVDVHNSCSISSFRRQLKTFFFSKFCHLQCPTSPQIRQASHRHYCALQKFTYLLTHLTNLHNLNLIKQSQMQTERERKRQRG